MKKKEHSQEKFITEFEKELLKKRIFNSITQLQVKRRNYVIGIAASIALVIAGGWYLQMQKSSSELNKFAMLSKNVDVQDSEKVTLILDENKGLAIDGDNTPISYSKTGEEISIGTQEKVNQQQKNNFNTLVVPYGKRSSLVLSDGTKVWLNSGSKFIYPAQFTGAKREVYLIGEAVFDVAHDKKHPFKVLSDHQEIEVLGTVFNVSSYEDELESFVVLKKGSVKVSHTVKDNFFFNKKKSQIITPGTLTKINRETGLVSSEQVDVKQYFSWKHGLLILEKSKLSYIMRKLSRYYNISISIEDEKLNNETFSGALDLSESIQEVLQIINKSVDVRFEETEKHQLKLMYN
ncbi:FecR family protein [Wenyingzhuangia aestuarii]|uniref:FecR family protein n=1 Tax=Wenyingzhuangia aestuarii TaxID=1647582 RepID=UPI00143CB4BC|nr:FecR domain-containing protein [Wenyingzhuangia aestuarii]NJB82783.1 ferric-dicitrate binding protein FerR (iron transport regulator) [Wenyingzhuangia aestuarii]